MKKKLIISIIVFVLLVSLSAAAIYMRFNPRFPADTVICGTDVSKKFTGGASARINETLDAYSITVDLGDKQRTFTSEELSITLDDDALREMASKLELGLATADDIMLLSIDFTPVSQWLYENIVENRVEPVAAHLVWNPEICEFELEGGVVGEYNDAAIALQIVTDSILRLDNSVTLTEADYHIEYTDPEQTAAEQEALDHANALVSRELTYNYHLRNGEYAAEVISSDILGNWVVIGEDGLTVSWNEEAIQLYAESMAETYSIQGEDYFLSHDGRTIDLTVNTPTNIVDPVALYEDIFSRLTNTDIGEGSVPYSEQTDAFNYDGTYIEISIGEQKLFGFVDGEIVFETPVITGCMHCDHGTKTGVFKIQNKDRNINLQGDNYYVQYWMGFFIPKYGLHDADGWREPEEYTTEKYLTDGSGGCVNIPRAVISEMYQTFDVGVPVIIYDESYVISEEPAADDTANE